MNPKLDAISDFNKGIYKKDSNAFNNVQSLTDLNKKLLAAGNTWLVVFQVGLIYLTL